LRYRDHAQSPQTAWVNAEYLSIYLSLRVSSRQGDKTEKENTAGEKTEKLLAFCSHCGRSQGTFDNEEELRLEIGTKKRCDGCDAEFGFLADGRIWNLRWQTILSDKAPGFWSILHKSIIEIAKKKFEDGHYADAVESALKEVNTRVKEIVKKKTGGELDGTSLMFKAFSGENPIITLGDLSTETGRSIQEGYMHIFAGAMLGIRNPKAHENIVISPESATHFLFLASLLMDMIDYAKY